MEFHSTFIRDLYVAELTPFIDNRGFFARTYCEAELKNINVSQTLTQINHSRTVQVGTVRGMHFQYPPHAEIKMVRCLVGAIFDVVIDIRKNSDTFLQWFGEYLTPDNFKMMVIPAGFAHGFQVIEPNSELLYFHTASYAPESESGILFNDEKVGITWPIKATELSDRDRNHEKLDENFTGIVL